MSTSQTINGLQHYLPAKSDAEFGGVLASLAAGLAYKQVAVVTFCGPSGLSAGNARGMRPGWEAMDSSVPLIRAPFAGVLIQAGLYVRCRTAPDANLSFDLLKNGVSITGIALLNSGATYGTAGQLTSVAVAAGDTLSMTVTAAGGYVTGGADLSVTLALVAA